MNLSSNGWFLGGTDDYRGQNVATASFQIRRMPSGRERIIFLYGKWEQNSNNNTLLLCESVL
jgi:hypothetical protein